MGSVMEMYAQIPLSKDVIAVPREYGLLGTPTYRHDGSHWVPAVPTVPKEISTMTLATYNVLHDSAFPLHFRLPALRNAILESNADIICLQEATDELLSSLLTDSRITAHFKWCSRSDSTVMENERNVILLAREDYGFVWTSVELGGKHKPATVACFRTPYGTIAIAGIHLTAGRASTILEKKRQELSTLVAYLQLHHSTDEWVVVGDTNWPDSEPFPLEDEFVDVWSIRGGETYDPTTNSLAAATAREARDPQRYDRIFVRRGGSLSVVHDSLRLFGLPLHDGGPASDHWGMTACIQIGIRSSAISDVPAINDVAPLPALELVPTNLTNAELHDLCVAYGCFPTDLQNGIFQQALETLRTFVSDLSPPTQTIDSEATSQPSTLTSVVRFVTIPVGSYAMGYHNSGSDIDCVVVGNINPGTFWNLMRGKIRAAGGLDSVRLKRFVKDASVQMMELEVHGVKMDVQYCPAGRLIDW